MMSMRARAARRTAARDATTRETADEPKSGFLDK